MSISTTHVHFIRADGARWVAVVDDAGDRPAAVRCYRVLSLAGGRRATRNTPCNLADTERRQIIAQLGRAAAGVVEAIAAS